MKKKHHDAIDRWARLLKQGGMVPLLVIGTEPDAPDTDYRLMTPDTMTPAEARRIIQHIADTQLRQLTTERFLEDRKPGEDLDKP